MDLTSLGLFGHFLFPLLFSCNSILLLNNNPNKFHHSILFPYPFFPHFAKYVRFSSILILILAIQTSKYQKCWKEMNENPKNQGERDQLYQSALDIVKSEGKASTSFLQRKLQIGYNRAARIIDMMEDEGIVSKANHVGKRDVL